MMRFTQARALAVGGTLAAALVAGGPVAYGALQGEDPGRGAAYVETRLFFGTERADGAPAVSDAQFMSFLDRRVTPAFPEGLTLQQGRGQWRNAHGVVEHERSYELLLLYPAKETAARDGRIERIRAAYAKEFAQESVGRADARARVDF